jgi:hypothetical protein
MAERMDKNRVITKEIRSFKVRQHKNYFLKISLLFAELQGTKRGVRRDLGEPSYWKHVSSCYDESVDIKNVANGLVTTEIWIFEKPTNYTYFDSTIITHIFSKCKTSKSLSSWPIFYMIEARMIKIQMSRHEVYVTRISKTSSSIPNS